MVYQTLRRSFIMSITDHDLTAGEVSHSSLGFPVNGIISPDQPVSTLHPCVPPPSLSVAVDTWVCLGGVNRYGMGRCRYGSSMLVLTDDVDMDDDHLGKVSDVTSWR
jgi:hypothetical protein